MFEKNQLPKTVLIEGNIASGKTHLLEYFKKFEGFEIVPEPIEKWINCSGFNLLVSIIKKNKHFYLTFIFL